MATGPGRARPGRSKIKDADIPSLLSDQSEISDVSSLEDSFEDPEFKGPENEGVLSSEEDLQNDENEQASKKSAVVENSSSRKRKLSVADDTEIEFMDRDIDDSLNNTEQDIAAEGESVKSVQGSGVVKWKGERLWPPQDSGKRKKRSPAWKHGGFLKDKSGQLVKTQVVCSHCGVTIAYHGSPSNFLQHLNKSHPTEMGVTAEADTPVKKITDMFSISTLGRKESKYPQSHPKQREHRKLTADWVIKSLRSFKTVEDEGFIKLVQHADPKLNTISRRTLVRDIEKRYEVETQKIIDELQNVEYFVCTNDGGSSKDTRSFIVVTLHWISREKGSLQMKKKILGMVELKKDKKAKTYRSEVDSLLEKFKVKEKVFLFLTDNENTMKAAFSRTERSGCFPHIVSKACKHALEDQECLSNLRQKIRDIVSKAHRSPKVKNQIIREQQLRGIKPSTLIPEVETRFTATQMMFASILNDKNRRTELEIDEEGAKLNVEAINAAMADPEVGLKEDEVEELHIKLSEVTMLIKLMEILEPIEEGVDLTGGDSYPTGCVLLKYIRFLDRLLSENFEDPSYIAKFKEKLQREIEERCKGNLNHNVLECASFFDKRNNLLKLFGAEKLQQITSKISEELHQLEESFQVFASH